MNVKTKITLCALASFVTLGTSVPGFAYSPNDAGTASAVVRYHDLDLSSSAGIRTLYGRIQNAAWRVCLQVVPSWNGIENTKCRQTAVDEAVAKVNKPALTAMHEGKKPSEKTASR
jgi:UrcA family protein